MPCLQTNPLKPLADYTIPLYCVAIKLHGTALITSLVLAGKLKMDNESKSDGHGQMMNTILGGSKLIFFS